MSIGGKNHSYVFTYFFVGGGDMVGRLLGKRGGFENYLLAFLSNSSEVDELFRSYGLPHTYLKASYRHVSEGSINYTYLRLDYPDGRTLIELSAATPSVPPTTRTLTQRRFLD